MQHTPFPEALQAVRDADPAAEVVVLAPSEAALALLRQTATDAGGYLRVHGYTAARLVDALAAPELARAGLRAPPPMWLEAVLVDAAARIVGPDGALALARRVRDHVDAPPPDLEDARWLRRLTDRLAEARAAEGIAGPQDRLRAARAGLARPPRPGARVLVVGDGPVAPAEAGILRGWLAGRTIACLADGPPRPGGLQACGRLDGARVLAAGPPPADVEALCAADDHEQVAVLAERLVQAVAAGTPARRVVAAVAPAQAPALARLLTAAGVGAVSLVPAAVSGLAPARALRLAAALAMDPGGATAEAWGALLDQPGLHVDGLGRGRWRAILAQLGGARGARRILAALDAWDEPAAAALAEVIAVQAGELGAFPRHGTLAQYGASFSAWLTRFWPETPNRGRVLARLAAFAGGPSMGIEVAVALLEEALATPEPAAPGLEADAVRIAQPHDLTAVSADLRGDLAGEEAPLPRSPSRLVSVRAARSAADGRHLRPPPGWPLAGERVVEVAPATHVAAAWGELPLASIRRCVQTPESLAALLAAPRRFASQVVLGAPPRVALEAPEALDVDVIRARTAAALRAAARPGMTLADFERAWREARRPESRRFPVDPEAEALSLAWGKAAAERALAAWQPSGLVAEAPHLELPWALAPGAGVVVGAALVHVCERPLRRAETEILTGVLDAAARGLGWVRLVDPDGALRTERVAAVAARVAPALRAWGLAGEIWQENDAGEVRLPGKGRRA